MKKLLLITVVILTAVLMSGCATKAKLIQTEPLPILITDLKEGNVSEVATRISTNKVRGIHELGLSLKMIAQKMKNEGYPYFIMKNNGPSYLTSLKDLHNYCNPASEPVTLEKRETSLEIDKCPNFRTSFQFIPLREPSLFVPTWSVEEVLSDKTILDSADKAMKDSGFEGMEVKTMNNPKEWITERNKY